MGIKIDVSSAGTLQKGIREIEDPNAQRLLEILSTKAMHRAKYFCAGMLDIAKYGHYALNTPLYAHFTSPIRRYADVIVHRQLESVLSSGKLHGVLGFLKRGPIDSNLLGSEPKFAMDRDSVAKVAQQCNVYVELCFAISTRT
jgi:protein SSD1